MIKNNIVIGNFPKENNIGSFAEWCPSPVIEINANKEIIYLNLVARTLFPNIAQLGIAHPVLDGLAESIDLLLEKTGKFSIFSRETMFNKSIFEQQVFSVEQTHSVMIYMIDITQYKFIDQRIEEVNKKLEEQKRANDERIKAMHVELCKSYDLLHKNKEQYNYALKAACIGIWSWDLPRDVLFLDENVHHLLGLESCAYISSFKTMINFVHLNDRDNLSAVLNESCLYNKECQINIRIVLPDGSIRPVMLKGKPRLDALGQTTTMDGIISLRKNDN